MEAHQFAQGIRAPIVFVGRDCRTGFGEIGSGADVAKAQQSSGIDGALQWTGHDKVHGNPELMQRLADRFGLRPPLLAELARTEQAGVTCCVVVRAVR